MNEWKPSTILGEAYRLRDAMNAAAPYMRGDVTAALQSGEIAWEPGRLLTEAHCLRSRYPLSGEGA